MPIATLSPFLLPHRPVAPPPALRRHRLPGPFGSEIRSLDLAAALPEATLAAIRTALSEELLLVFRGQRLGPAQQIAFTRRLGQADSAAVAIESGRAADAAWQRDGADSATPGRVSILQVAEAGPGAIAFASQRAAYDRLDPWLAHAIEYLEVAYAPAGVTHPLVRIDPATGSRSLFLDGRGDARIPGLPEAEGARLLARLHEAATAPALQARHAWQPGDVLVWDNHALLHRIEPDMAGRAPRLLRSLVAGEAPIGPAAVAVPWLIAG